MNKFEMKIEMLRGLIIFKFLDFMDINMEIKTVIT